MLCLRKTDKRMQVDQTIFGLGDGLTTLASDDPALAATMGLFGQMMDPSLPRDPDVFTPELERGLGLLAGFMASDNAMYSGAPLRVGGRTIGTFCCLYLDIEEVDQERKAMQLVKAERAGKILETIAEMPSSPAK